MLLKEDLFPHVMDNLKKIVQAIHEHNAIGETLHYAMGGHLLIGPTSIQLEGQNPLMDLDAYDLINVSDYASNGQPVNFVVTPQGFRAVDADFEIEVGGALLDVKINQGDQYNFYGDFINSSIAIGSEAIAIARDKVISDLGGSNAALTEAVKELARVISDKPDDRPDVLSKLSQVMKLLSQAHGLVKIVAPMVIKALKVVDLLP